MGKKYDDLKAKLDELYKEVLSPDTEKTDTNNIKGLSEAYKEYLSSSVQLSDKEKSELGMIFSSIYIVIEKKSKSELPEKQKDYAYKKEPIYEGKKQKQTLHSDKKEIIATAGKTSVDYMPLPVGDTNYVPNDKSPGKEKEQTIDTIVNVKDEGAQKELQKKEPAAV